MKAGEDNQHKKRKGTKGDQGRGTVKFESQESSSGKHRKWAKQIREGGVGKKVGRVGGFTVVGPTGLAA